MLHLMLQFASSHQRSYPSVCTADSMPHLSVKAQNLKSQNTLQKYSLISLLEDCFFSRHTTALVQYHLLISNDFLLISN